MNGFLISSLVAWAASEPGVPPPAKPATWELAWTAPAACPEASAIRAQVAALVPDLTGGEGVLEVEATVRSQGDEYVLTLRTTFAERHDEREARSRVCDELVEAVALVVAISLDPSFVQTGASPREPRPEISEAGAPSPPRPLAPLPSDEGHRRKASATSIAPARRSKPRRPDAWTTRLAPMFEIGGLPPVGGGLELAIGIAWPWWRLEIHGAYLWPRRASGSADRAATFQLGTVGMRGCGRPRVGRVELPVCLGLDTGALRVDSENPEPPRVAHGPWIAPTVGAGVAIGGPRVGFWSLLEGSAALVRTRILVGDEVMFRPYPVAGRWLAGVEVFFAIPPATR